MRIVAGKYKGRILHSFKNSSIRPTTDMTRQAIFNILSENFVHDILGKNFSECGFLDVFCGTGAISCEAVSRGISNIGIIDINKTSLSLAEKNLSIMSDDIQNLDKFCHNIKRGKIKTISKVKYDIIFIDPPYQEDLANLAIYSISEILNQDVIFIIEKRSGSTINNIEIDKLIKIKQKRYGISELLFYTNWKE